MKNFSIRALDKIPETKTIGGYVIETKQVERNGEPIGLVSGYMATWDIDRGHWGMRDRFIKGAFLESINEHKLNRNRQVRFKDNHGRVVGGFPIDGVHEDDTGLFGTAEVNLDIQQGNELFSIIKQGVIVDFSIGFAAIDFETETVDEDDIIRNITKAIIFEASAVSEPMNPKAVITDVKALGETVEKVLRLNESLNDDQIKQILAELESIDQSVFEDKHSLVKISDIKLIEDLKSLEKLLKKQGFSDNAATAFVAIAFKLKAGNRGDLEDGANDNQNDDQGELESQEILTLMKSMNSDIEDSNILHELKLINR